VVADSRAAQVLSVDYGFGVSSAGTVLGAVPFVRRALADHEGEGGRIRVALCRISPHRSPLCGRTEVGLSSPRSPCPASRRVGNRDAGGVAPWSMADGQRILQSRSV